MMMQHPHNLLYSSVPPAPAPFAPISADGLSFWNPNDRFRPVGEVTVSSHGSPAHSQTPESLSSQTETCSTAASRHGDDHLTLSTASLDSYAVKAGSPAKTPTAYFQHSTPQDVAINQRANHEGLGWGPVLSAIPANEFRFTAFDSSPSAINSQQTPNPRLGTLPYTNTHPNVYNTAAIQSHLASLGSPVTRPIGSQSTDAAYAAAMHHPLYSTQAAHGAFASVDSGHMARQGRSIWPNQ
ncbi:unnamed protein product [Parajaminaea phylloscopi]